MPTVEEILSALGEVQDPEFPVSIVDMGLVRGVEVERKTITVRLTFTSLACPCTDIIREDVTARLERFEDVECVRVEEVFEAWSREDLSEEARTILRSLAVI